MRFSERQGLRSAKTLLQTNSMDEALRNRLWNGLTLYCWKESRQRITYAIFRTFEEEWVWLVEQKG
jgi:hypothetical protein